MQVPSWRQLSPALIQFQFQTQQSVMVHLARRQWSIHWLALWAGAPESTTCHPASGGLLLHSWCWRSAFQLEL